MKGKQLPDDFADWIKARTFIIGEETALELDLQSHVGKAADNEEKLRRQSEEECLETREAAKIAPAFRLEIPEFSFAPLCHTE
jgi:hypothetical protein